MTNKCQYCDKPAKRNDIIGYHWICTCEEHVDNADERAEKALVKAVRNSSSIL